MTSQRKAIVYSNVRQFSEQGHEALRSGDVSKASVCFSHALEKAELYGDEFLIRACSFNLGSCLVAFGEASRGLVYLTRAVPPQDQSDGPENFADLQYNIGIAKHAVGDVVNAVLAYEKAANLYKELHNKPLQIETLNKLAMCYKALKQPKEAAQCLNQIADLYKDTDEKENRAITLSHLIMVLAELKKMDECSKALSTLLELCHDMDNPKLKGKIYNDIGLLYSSEHCYKSASECFEHAYHALEEVKRVEKDKMLEAVVLMNMGASLNHLELFERAIAFHKMAIMKYDEAGNQRGKIQALCNLAFAHSKTEEYKEAKIAFKDAIKCCKDCSDHMEASLATEGLAAIYFREGDYDSAISNYKEALAILTKLDTVNPAHSERLVNKLAEAVQYQLSAKEGIDAVDGVANGELRHLGRRRGKHRYETHNSLVAKGLEETNNELEEVSSTEDESYSSDATETRSERSVPTASGEDRGHLIVENRLSNDINGINANGSPEFVDRRRHHSVQSYMEADGNIRVLENDVEEIKKRHRRKTQESGPVRNSRTCIVQ